MNLKRIRQGYYKAGRWEMYRVARLDGKNWAVCSPTGHTGHFNTMMEASECIRSLSATDRRGQ